MPLGPQKLRQLNKEDDFKKILLPEKKTTSRKNAYIRGDMQIAIIRMALDKLCFEVFFLIQFM